MEINTAEILRQVRRLEIYTKKAVSEMFSGGYLSVFKGRGIEFAEVREYSPGDDVRAIDWNVTARQNKPFVKVFTEERELTIVIACDISGSQNFGARVKLKKQCSAELSALFSLSALKNNDKAALMLFSSVPELYIPPKKGKKHILRLIREIIAFRPKHKGTSIKECLSSLNKILKRRAIIVLISDFADEDFDKEFRLCAKKHDLIPIAIEDKSEDALLSARGLFETEDPETGEAKTVDLSSSAFKSEYRKKLAQRRIKLKNLFASARTEPIHISVEHAVIDPVMKYFRKRARQNGRK